MNILLGDITSYKAITVAKFVHKFYPNIRIYGFDTRDFSDKIHTKYVFKNFVLKEYSIESLLAIIDNFNIDFFLPVINESLASFWKNKDKFRTTLKYLGDFSAYELLNDKSQLHNIAIELNILVPKKYDDLESAKYPFIIKPTNLSSAKGVIYVKSENDISNNFKKKNTIIQQFVKGEGVGFSFYCKNGNIMNSYGHRRLAEYPVSGGSSTYREIYEDERMFNISSKIVNILNYTGFAMFEFKLTADNELYLLEVNPRIWGSINQGLADGTNYFEEIFGKTQVKFKNNKNDVYTYLGPLVYISFLKYLLQFNVKPIFIFMANLFNNKPDINIFNDPRGYLSTILRKLIR